MPKEETQVQEEVADNPQIEGLGDLEPEPDLLDNPSTEEVVEDSEPEETEKEELIAGKFKSQEELAKAYEGLQSEFNTKATELDNLKAARELHELMQKNPEVARDVAFALQNPGLSIKDNKGAVQEQPADEGFSEPPPPDYNEYDAVNSPDSQSYAWRKKERDYYYNKTLADAEERAYKRVHEENLKQQAKIREQQIEQQFRESMALDDDSYKGFVEWAEKPKDPLDQLKMLYSVYKNKDAMQNLQKQAGNDVVNQIRKVQDAPDTLAGADSVPEEPKTEEEEFLESLIGEGNKGLGLL